MAVPERKERVQLRVPERIQPAQDLWDGLRETPEDVPLSEAQRQELDRRRNAYRADREPGARWVEVRRRITH